MKRERPKVLTRVVGVRITEKDYEKLLEKNVNITKVLRRAIKEALK